MNIEKERNLMLHRIKTMLTHPKTLWSGALLLVLAAVLLAGQSALASREASPAPQISPLHPTFALLDSRGQNVLESNQPVSTLDTCGQCHDTRFIENHSFHASVGLDEFGAPGSVTGGQPWEMSPGMFGGWNPLGYRYLTPTGDERLDLSTAGWIMMYGARHIGGGPAQYSRDGSLLTQLAPDPQNPETSLLDPQTGEPVAWDWQESGLVEMNCFLCHTPNPNNDARVAALQSGAFGWANTATLLGSGIVEADGDGYRYRAEAFEADGELAKNYVAIQDPTNENCGQCHGLVHASASDPLVTTACAPDIYRTVTTGQIISGQRMAGSGLNLEDKDDLTRSWDIHAERLVECTDCHFSLNNPVYQVAKEGQQPEYLTFDPRRLEFGEYLYQPLHQFARGESAQTTVAPELKDTMRRCDSCHNAGTTHDWLPYKESHFEAVSCESCHIPKMYSSARQMYDWTVINPAGESTTACRGVVQAETTQNTLLTGYQPVLLPRQGVDGDVKLAPYNLITFWYWVYGDPPRPVRLLDLQAAWLDGETYHPAVLAAFDQDGNGDLSDGELVIDSVEKESLIASRLSALGLDNPRIQGEIQPYSINHDVATGEWATSDCQACHTEDSRLSQPFLLASYLPGGTLPAFTADSNTSFEGKLTMDDDGELFYQPATSEDGLYVLGHNAVRWIDLLGSLFFAGVLLGIAVHGGLRFYASLRQPRPNGSLEKIYMYTVYERLWHWLQTFAIVLLLFTGLIIHRPEAFGIFSFRYVVLVHNVLAAVLVINAALSLFYHLVSGEIKQFIPRPRGFFDQAITQAQFYLRGIFKRGEHPFEKTPEEKLNPLQQVTYFGILNVLLPLQILTGALMWGVQRWPEIANALGGLPFLAPFHTLIAWLFASFILGHVYLTTTGHAPLAGIKAMMMGWEELEVHGPAEEAAEA